MEDEDGTKQLTHSVRYLSDTPSEQYQHEIMDFREEFLRNHETAYGTEQLTDARALKSG